MYDFIQSSWGLGKWLDEAWELINDDERDEIKSRVDSLFANGLPLELKHDKIIYIYIFSMLSQLEIVAVQVPLKFLTKLDDKKLFSLMRRQLIDEIFHTIVFSKIAYELSQPYGFPPELNESITKLCSIITDGDDARTTIILLNLVAEGWIEQAFDMLAQHGVSPRVFDVVLEDERRHVAEGELYRSLGVNNLNHLTEKLEIIEHHLTTYVFLQRKYIAAMIHIMGIEGCLQLVSNIDERHRSQLKKINLKPSQKWTSFVKVFPKGMGELVHNHRRDECIPMSMTRKSLIRRFDTPSDPTMFSLFNLDVTKAGYFENKYPPQTITGLMLQAISKLKSDNSKIRQYVSHDKLYQTHDNSVHLVVNLPGATNHLAMLKLTDCHKLSLHELSEHVAHDIEIMSYCRFKAQEIADRHPEFSAAFDDFFLPNPNEIFKEIMLPNPIFSLSNVAPWGHEQALSPLLPFEVLKFTLAKVKREQVWNHHTKCFEIKDLLPVGLSADHRVFDGNTCTPKAVQICFDQMLQQLENSNKNQNEKPIKAYSNLDEFIKFSDKILEHHLDLGFRYLMLSSQLWNNDSNVKSLIDRSKGLK